MKNTQTEEHKLPTRYRMLLIVAAVAVFAFLLIANLDTVNLWLGKLFSLLAPLFTGLVLAYLANPFFRLFERRVLARLNRPKLRRVLALLLTYLVLLAIIAGLLLLIIPQLVASIQNFVDESDTHMASMVESINSLLHSLNQKLPAKADGSPFIPSLNREIILTKASELWEKLMSVLDSLVIPENMGLVRELLDHMTKFFIDLVFGIMISVYLLASKEKCYAYIMRFRRAFLSERINESITRFVSIADRSFGGFLRGKLLDSCIVGLMVYVTCLIFDIPYGILVAVIVGITDIVPVIGPFIGVVPTAIIILLTDPVKVIIFLVSILVIQQIDGNIIAPKILGENTGVSSLCVLISILIMGDLLGFVGMVVAVPFFATVIELCKLWLDSRLRKKGLSGDLDTYYAEDALPDPTEEEKPEAYVSPEAVYSPVAVNPDGDLTETEQNQLRAYVAMRRHSALTDLSDEALIRFAEESAQAFRQHPVNHEKGGAEQ